MGAQQAVRHEWASPPQLGKGEGVKLQEGDPPRERLAHFGKQQELLGAGQDEAAGLPLEVDQRLDVREKLRRPLSFVEDDASRVAAEKPHWIPGRELPLFRVFQGHVAVLRENQTRQRGFSRLARAGEGDDRVLRGEPFQHRCEGSCEHTLR